MFESKIFKCTLNSENSLKYRNIMRWIASLFNIINIEITSDGLRIVAMDNLHISMVEVFLSENFFETYDFINESMFAIYLDYSRSELSKRGDKELEILFEDGMGFLIRNISDKVVLFQSRIIEYEEISKISMDFENSLKLATKELLFLSDGMIKAKNVTFYLSQNEFFIKLGNYYVNYDLKTRSSVSVKSDVKVNFSLEYIAKIFRAGGFAEFVTIWLGTEMPMKIEYSISSDSYATVLLAPSIEENDDSHLRKGEYHYTTQEIIEKERLRKLPTDIKIEKDQDFIDRKWSAKNFPWRELVFWGWDSENNPCFIILFGSHKTSINSFHVNQTDVKRYKELIKSKKITLHNPFTKHLDKQPEITFEPDIKDGSYRILNEEIAYTHLIQIIGKGGHFPPRIEFNAEKKIRMEQTGHRYYRRRQKKIETGRYNIVPKYKDRSYNQRIRNLIKFEDKDEVLVYLPYSKNNNYEDLIQTFKKVNKFANSLKLADHLNQILELGELSYEYGNLIYDMMSKPNLYVRKKLMTILVGKNPPKAVYERLLDIGSAEVVSGLFLELAKCGNPILTQEAEQLLTSDIDWAEAKYARGIKRCAKIYYTASNLERRTRRIEEIYKIIPKLDIKKTIREEKKSYGRRRRRHSYKFNVLNYENGPFNEGPEIKHMAIKNLLQEAEIYQIPDVFGKITCLLDSAKLANLWSKKFRGTLDYLRRYARRVIDSYAQDDEEKFIKAIFTLLTSYTEEDKIGYNFIKNEILRHYLYFSYKEQRRYGYYQRSTNQESYNMGRCDFHPEIWNRHLDEIVNIAIDAKILPVLEFCHKVLESAPGATEFIQNLPFKYIVKLSIVPYTALSTPFMEKMRAKLDSLHTFDEEIFLALIDTQSRELTNLGLAYFERTGGHIKPKNLVELVRMESFRRDQAEWENFIQANMDKLDAKSFSEFILTFIANTTEFNNPKNEISSQIMDVLSSKLDLLKDVSNEKKAEIITSIFNEFSAQSALMEWLESYLIDLLFSISFEEMLTLAKKINIDVGIRAKTSRNRQVTALIKAVVTRTIPSDLEILKLLEEGTPRMVNFLMQILESYKNMLKDRFSTILLMLESKTTVLNLIATQIFDKLNEVDKGKIISVIIDSSIERAYKFGLNKIEEIYGELIPENIILQMLEHSTADVKTYAIDKLSRIIDEIGKGNEVIFNYYVKTLLLLPNLQSKAKSRIYELIPDFCRHNEEIIEDMEVLLQEIAQSNIILDTERSLVALAKVMKIREELS